MPFTRPSVPQAASRVSSALRPTAQPRRSRLGRRQRTSRQRLSRRPNRAGSAPSPYASRHQGIPPPPSKMLPPIGASPFFALTVALFTQTSITAVRTLLMPALPILPVRACEAQRPGTDSLSEPGILLIVESQNGDSLAIPGRSVFRTHCQSRRGRQLTSGSSSRSASQDRHVELVQEAPLKQRLIVDFPWRFSTAFRNHALPHSDKLGALRPSQNASDTHPLLPNAILP